MARALESFLGRFFEVGKDHEVKWDTWSQVKLENPILKQSALDDLDLPFSIVAGKARRLELNINAQLKDLTSLSKKSHELILEDLEVSCRPKMYEIWNSEREKKRKLERKMRQIAIAEELFKKKESRWFEQFSVDLLSNLKIRITNAKITALFPWYSYSIVASKIDIHNVERAPGESVTATRHKLFNLHDIALQFTAGDTVKELIKLPNMTIKLAYKLHSVAFDCSVIIEDDVTMTMTRREYQALVFTITNLFEGRFLHKISQFKNATLTSWRWKFLRDVLRQRSRRRKDQTAYKVQLRKYLFLFAKCKAQQFKGKISSDQKKVLHCLTICLPRASLLKVLPLAYFISVRHDKPKEQQTAPSWFGWWGKKQAYLGEDLKSGGDENQFEALCGTQGNRVKFEYVVKKTVYNLMDNSESSARVELHGLTLGVDINEGDVSITAGLEDFVVSDRSEIQEELILSKAGQMAGQRLFNISVAARKDMSTGLYNFRTSFLLNPVNMQLNTVFLRKLKHWFVAPRSTMVVSMWNRLKKMGDTVISTVQKETSLLEFEDCVINAPIITIPNVSKTEFLIANFGKLWIKRTSTESDRQIHYLQFEKLNVIRSNECREQAVVLSDISSEIEVHRPLLLGDHYFVKIAMSEFNVALSRELFAFTFNVINTSARYVHYNSAVSNYRDEVSCTCKAMVAEMFHCERSRDSPDGISKEHLSVSLEADQLCIFDPSGEIRTVLQLNKRSRVVFDKQKKSMAISILQDDLSYYYCFIEFDTKEDFDYMRSHLPIGDMEDSITNNELQRASWLFHLEFSILKTTLSVEGRSTVLRDLALSLHYGPWVKEYRVTLGGIEFQQSLQDIFHRVFKLRKSLSARI